MAHATIKRHDRVHSEKLDYVVPGFTNANFTDDPVAVDDTIITGGLNFNYDSGGSVQTAKGFVRVNTTNLPAVADNGWMFETPTIRQLIVATVAGYLYKYDNAGAWVQIGGPYTAASRWDGAQGRNNMYFVNGYDGILQWDGTSMTTLAITGYAAIKPQYIINRKNRLYFAERNSSLVWFTDPLVFNVIQSNSFVQMNTDDGQVITGLGSTADNVVVGKDRSVWNIVGEPLTAGATTYVGNLQIKKSNSDVGPVSYKTIQTIAHGVQVFAATSGIFVHQNYQTTSISPALDAIFRNDMNPNYRHLMWSVYNPLEKKLLVGYCSLVATTPDKVLMLDMSGVDIKFAIWDDYNVAFGLQYKFTNTPVTLLGCGGVILQGFTGYSHMAGDNGTATGGSTTTIIDSSKIWTTNQFANCRVQIVSGTGHDQSSYIVSNTATTLTISPALITAPDVSSVYTIGGYHSYVDTKIFDFSDPALTKKYKFTNLFLDSAATNYLINIGIAYGKLALQYSLTANLNAATWYYEADNSVNAWVWGSAALRFGSTVSLYDQVNLGGNDRFLQMRIGTFKANQPWRCNKYSFTYKEKKARPN